MEECNPTPCLGLLLIFQTYRTLRQCLTFTTSGNLLILLINSHIVSPRRDPRPFFKFAREIYPGQFSPSPCHRFIAALESGKKLLRNYTQNIDTLEQEAGISKVASILKFRSPFTLRFSYVNMPKYHCQCP